MCSSFKFILRNVFFGWVIICLLLYGFNLSYECSHIKKDYTIYKAILFADKKCNPCMIKEGSILFVAFGGTRYSKTYDLIQNTKMNLVSYTNKSKEKVYSGFLQDWKNVKDEFIMDILSFIEMNQEVDNIIFSGHSSGASSATFAAYDLEELLDETIDMEIITFGSPRFCNKEFAIEVEQKIQITRIVNRKDIVPVFPFYIMGYRHMGDFNHIWNECYIKEFSFNKVMWSNFIGIFNFDGIRDHRSHKYKMALI